MKRFFLILVAIAVACKQPSKPTAKPGAGPTLAATVISISTKVGEKTTNHEIVIANGRARSTNELDVWRHYDTKAETITFVDDVDKTIRVEPLQSLLQSRQKTMAAALPAHFAHAKLSRGSSKQLLGRNAQQHVIEAGAYRRELWIATHPAIPDDLFAMMLASDAPSSPLAPMMRSVDEQLLRAKGFPLLDRAEVPLANAANVVERTVTSIATRQVPVTMLSVPRGYRDVTPKPAAAKTTAAPR